MVPYTPILKVLVRRLRVDSQRLRVGEGLHGDVELRIGTEVAAPVAEIRPLEEGGVRKWLLITLKAIAAITCQSK